MLMDVRVTWLIVAPFFQASAGSRPSYETPQRITKVKNIREISVESLNLEPLCDEVFLLPILCITFVENNVNKNEWAVCFTSFIYCTLLSYQSWNLIVVVI